MKFTPIHVNTQREIFTYGVYVNIKICKGSFNLVLNLISVLKISKIISFKSFSRKSFVAKYNVLA